MVPWKIKTVDASPFPPLHQNKEIEWNEQKLVILKKKFHLDDELEC